MAWPASAAGAALDQPHDRPERGRFAGPVAAHERRDLAPAQAQRHPEEHLRAAVKGVKSLHVEKVRGGVEHGG